MRARRDSNSRQNPLRRRVLYPAELRAPNKDVRGAAVLKLPKSSPRVAVCTARLALCDFISNCLPQGCASRYLRISESIVFPVNGIILRDASNLLTSIGRVIVLSKIFPFAWSAILGHTGTPARSWPKTGRRLCFQKAKAKLGGVDVRLKRHDKNSGGEDLNFRPLGPKPSALPG